MGFPTSHQPRFFAAPNFIKMGIKVPRLVVFWTISTVQDEKSAAKFHYITRTLNSSGDEIANVNFYAVRPESYQIR